MRIASTDDLKRWAAFLDLCAMLAPKGVGAVPFRDDMDWELIVRLASEHMASPAVWRAVDNAAAAPQEVKAYFAAIHHMNARRNQMILEGLEELLARFDEFRIKYVLLKGGASVASGLYDDPAERMLTDIDVLVATEQIKEAETALRSNGYKDAIPIETGSRRWFRSANHHLPPLGPANRRDMHRTSHFIGAVEEIRIAIAAGCNLGTRVRSSMERTLDCCSASDRFSDSQYCALATHQRFILLLDDRT